METTRVEELLESFRTKHILVIGDVMLDEFIWGKVSRISPEAPVPVVEVTGESSYPGGAANVGRNLKEFCEEAHVLGVIGVDRHGEQLKNLMIDLGLSIRCLFDDQRHSTTVKTRIVARQQQMVRVDREQCTAPSGDLLEAALGSLKRILPMIDAVIFEDYAKGLLTQEFVSQATQLIVEAGKIVTADPNPKNPLNWLNLTAIKPNRQEAFRCAGVIENDPDEDFSENSRLMEVSDHLFEKWQSRYLLITLGENGMVLFERDAAPWHIPTRAQEVYDVSGAGDTAISLFTLALAAGATAREAAEISNQASSVVVGKLGTATLTPGELLASFQRPLTSSLEARELNLPRYVNPLPRPEVQPGPAELKVELVSEVSELRSPPKIERKPARTQGVLVPAVFLDRDGTLIEEVDYCSKPEDVHVFPFVFSSLVRLQAAGFLTIIVTNQAGIGRGYFTEEDYQKVHAELLAQIGSKLINATYYCPKHPDQAGLRRKPGIGMIKEASEQFGIDLSRSWMIGDKESDIACGKAAGVKTILVETGYGRGQPCNPDFRVRDLAAAVDWIVVS